MTNNCVDYAANIPMAQELMAEIKILSGGQLLGVAERIDHDVHFQMPDGELVLIICDHCRHRGYCDHRLDLASSVIALDPEPIDSRGRR